MTFYNAEIKISSPIAIRMIPPRIEARPESFVPNFFPICRPAKLIANVIIPIMNEVMNALTIL